MTLDVDALIDRRRLKRRLIAWRTVAVLALAGVIFLAVTDGGSGLFDPGTKAPHVAKITISGIITEDDNLLEELQDIADDDMAKALIVHVDSPGGTVVGGETLYNAIRAVAKEKPVVATMGTTAASAGYMVAVAANRIYAHSGTITGSIGVLMQAPNVVGLLDKLGVGMDTIKSAPLKAVPSPLEKMTPEGRAATQAIIDDMYDMFKDMVREQRRMPAEKVATLADGRIYTGRQALANGLVDEIGGDDEVRDWLENEHKISVDLPLIDRDPSEESGWFSASARALVHAIGGKALLSERLILDGLMALWHPDLRS
jgi:protease-4